MKKNIAFLIGLILSGCQTPKIDKAPDAVLALEKAARSISMKQVKLHESGALHQKRSQFAQPILSEDNRVNADWQGDALALLAQLARQRGLTFAYSGHRLPLPVNVSVQEMRFDALLRQIETQISCRATLKRHPHSLHLFFSLPEKAGHR